MKLWHAASIIVGIAGILGTGPAAKKQVTIVFSGDLEGYLSPCGCSYPMIGGIKRRATAIRGLADTSELIVVDNGGLVAGTKRQDEIKAEALSEAFAMMNADAINLGVEEANLGPEMLASMQRLSEGKFISTHLPSPAPLSIKPYVAKNGFLIGAVCMHPEPISKALSVPVLSPGKAIARLMADAASKKLKPFLLLRGTEGDARKIAQANPKLSAIVFSGAGDPLSAPVRVGKTVLVTPGEFGKFLTTLSQSSQGSFNYKSASLSPEYKDDPIVSGTYYAYLDRIKEERLIDQWPRVQTEAYAGSEACSECHVKTYRKWKETAHAEALHSLEKYSHDLDPDCVSCHVIGLSSKAGFVSRAKTPLLADVGCEACHGPLLSHSQDPEKFKAHPPKEECTSCHDINHSTKFDYKAYWSKIEHSGKPVDKETVNKKGMRQYSDEFESK